MQTTHRRSILPPSRTASRRLARLALPLVGALLLLWLIGLPAQAAAVRLLEDVPTSTLVLEAAFTTVNHGWVQVERWRDTRVMFQPEDYPADGRNDQTAQRAIFFGDSQPHSGLFLLYYAPGWDTGAQPTPVLLVHGANDNADRGWADPSLSGNCGADSCPGAGLMQFLAGQGYRVFAINFPHMHGDNYYWAQQIHDAIKIIKSNTGAAQVDVIAWSKGGFAARQYVSSVHLPGGEPYSGSVRRLILLGAPNKGIDYAFRHGILPSVGVYPECGINANAPAVHTWLVCYGFWRSHKELTLYDTNRGDAYPGQKQMLYRWDDVYGLDVLAQDWWTTYYGGWGFFSYSLGINYAINQGGLVSAIRSAGIPAGITANLYCGGDDDIPEIYNEKTGPSDGVLFIQSCSDTGGIGTVGDVVVNNSLNHLELGWHGDVAAQVDAWLSN